MLEFTAPPSRSWLQRLGDLAFGTERAVRVRVVHQMPATVAFICCAGFLLYSINVGMVPRAMGMATFFYLVIGQACFYAVLRSGFSLRFRDPGLMLMQNGFSLIAISLGYSMLGPIRGAPMMLATTVLVYGMFSLKPSQTIWLGAFTVVLFGVTMGIMVHVDPVGYPRDIELMRFVLILTTLPVVSFCACLIARMREHLVRQKQELREALERAQVLATHDVLTGLINRQRMQELLEQECARQDRHGGAFSVAIIDLDFFKRINDTYGHQAGDHVLKGLAEAASGVLRNVDVVARWGGEEFLVLFPATPASPAGIGLQRLRSHLQSAPILLDHPGLHVNFSAGLAEHLTEESIDALLERADRALYQAKGQGRGQDVLAA